MGHVDGLRMGESTDKARTDTVWRQMVGSGSSSACGHTCKDDTVPCTVNACCVG
jgi:hypothetical protein